MDEYGEFSKLITLEEVQQNIDKSFEFMNGRLQQQQNMILDVKNMLQGITDTMTQNPETEENAECKPAVDLDLEKLQTKLQGTCHKKILPAAVSGFWGKFRKKSWEKERQELITEICQMPFGVEQMKILTIAVRSSLLSAEDVRMVANPDCDPERMYLALEFLVDIKG